MFSDCKSCYFQHGLFHFNKDENCNKNQNDFLVRNPYIQRAQFTFTEGVYKTKALLSSS